MQKAKITVIYSQNVMLDDNTICLSSFMHSSHSTPSSIIFQTDLVFIEKLCWQPQECKEEI